MITLNKLWRLVVPEIVQISVIVETGLVELDDGYGNIGTMIGYPFTVDEQIGQIDSQFRMAFSVAESGNMFTPDGGCQTVDDVFQRFNA